MESGSLRMRKAGGRHGMNGREGGMVRRKKAKQRGWERGMKLTCRFDRLLSGLSEFFLVLAPASAKDAPGWNLGGHIIIKVCC